MLFKIHKKDAPEDVFETINITRTEALILKILDGESLHGYEIYKRSGGILNLNGLYVHLQRIKDKGLLSTSIGDRPDARLPKVFYTRTFDFAEIAEFSLGTLSAKKKLLLAR